MGEGTTKIHLSRICICAECANADLWFRLQALFLTLAWVSASCKMTEEAAFVRGFCFYRVKQDLI